MSVNKLCLAIAHIQGLYPNYFLNGTFAKITFMALSYLFTQSSVLTYFHTYLHTYLLIKTSAFTCLLYTDLCTYLLTLHIGPTSVLACLLLHLPLNIESLSWPQ